MYFNEIISANNFTKSIGLPGENIAPENKKRYLNDISFFSSIGQYLKIDDPLELVAKCNIVSQVICEIIQQKLGCNAYLTIGDVIFNGKGKFNVNQSYITDIMKTGKKSLIPQEYRHHAWITLDSMEIIDFTINTSIALLADDLPKEDRKKMLGGILAGHADELKNGVKYQPVLIGDSFYREYDSLYTQFKSHYTKFLNIKENSSKTTFEYINHNK